MQWPSWVEPWLPFVPVASALTLGLTAVTTFSLTQAGYIDCDEGDGLCEKWPRKYPDAWDDYEFPQCQCVENGEKFPYISETGAGPTTHPVFVSGICLSALLWLWTQHLMYRVTANRLAVFNSADPQAFIPPGEIKMTPRQAADDEIEEDRGFSSKFVVCCCCRCWILSVVQWCWFAGVCQAVGMIGLSIMSVRLMGWLHSLFASLYYISTGVHMYLYTWMSLRIRKNATGIMTVYDWRMLRWRLFFSGVMMCLALSTIVGWFAIREARYEYAYSRHYGPIMQYLFGFTFILYAFSYGRDIKTWYHVVGPGSVPCDGSRNYCESGRSPIQVESPC